MYPHEETRSRYYSVQGSPSRVLSKDVHMAEHDLPIHSKENIHLFKTFYIDPSKSLSSSEQCLLAESLLLNHLKGMQRQYRFPDHNVHFAHQIPNVRRASKCLSKRQKFII